MSDDVGFVARARLGVAIEGRSEELRLTWAEVASRAGLSPQGLLLLRKGKGKGEIRRLTKRGVEEALNWAPGSVDAILAGGDPTPIRARQPEWDRNAREADAARELNRELEDDDLDRRPGEDAVDWARRLMRELRGEDDRDQQPGESKADWAFRLVRELVEEAEKDPAKRRALEAMRDSWRDKDAG